MSEIDAEFGLESAVLFFDAFNSVRVEVDVDVEIDAFERAVHDVGFQIKSHTRKCAELAEIEAEHVFYEIDDVFGDKTLNERNNADDKTEIARHTQHLMTVAVVHDRTLACAEQNVDKQLFNRQMSQIDFDKAVDESADVITHKGVVKNGREIELIESVRKSGHKLRHIDRIGINDVHAVPFLYSAHVGNQLAFIVVRAEKQCAFTVFRHRADGVFVDGSAVDFGRELAELDEDLALGIVLRIDLACKARHDE